MPSIRLFSSDFNGTLVHEHTMSEMIRLYIGQNQYQIANEMFKRQTSGTVSMQEAFQTAGPLTKGLTLRQAIEHARKEMRFVDGFQNFVDRLAERDVAFIINSTSYSVTIYAIKELVGLDKIHGFMGNFLRFGEDSDVNATLREDELEQKVREYFRIPERRIEPMYDRIQATGVIDLGISDEEAKATLLKEYIKRHFREIRPDEIVHMGDTMGDSGGIFRIAKEGGIGIAFNYNTALREFLMNILKTESIPGKIYLIDPKSESSNLARTLPILS